MAVTMQSRPEDTPKVIALSTLIMLVFGYLLWYQTGGRDAAQASNVSRSPVLRPKTPAARTGQQSAPVAEPESISPGQMRLFQKGLDRDPFGDPPPTPAHPNAFVPLSRPSVAPTPRTSGPNGPGQLPSFAAAGFSLSPLPPVAATDAATTSDTPAQRMLIAAPAPLEVTLDGVATLANGQWQAMLTLRPASAQGSRPNVAEAGAATGTRRAGEQAEGVGERTLYRRAGERILTAHIVQITRDGLVLENARTLWPVGQTRRFDRVPTAGQNRERSEEKQIQKGTKAIRDAEIPVEGRP